MAQRDSTPVRGRPSTFDPAVFEAITDEIAFGVPATIACPAHGVLRETFYKWLELDRSLFFRLEEKRAAEIRDCLEAIKGKREQTPWQAKAWTLERVYGDHFRAPDQRSNTTVNVLQSNAALTLSPEQLEEHRTLLNAAQRTDNERLDNSK